MAIRVDAAFAQFENLNSLRAYPFVDDGSLTSKDGRVLPDDIISDLHIVMPTTALDGQAGRITDAPIARLSSVHVSDVMVSACIKTEYGGSICALSVIVSRGEFKPYYPYKLKKLAGTNDAGGIISFGNIDFSGGATTYFFDGACIHPSCVAMIKPPLLRSIMDPRSGERLSGDVEFDFTSYIESKKTGNLFELSMSSESEIELMSKCESALGDNPCGATPITSINGVAPDADGNIVLWFH